MFLSVAYVLGGGCRAEIGLAIVKTVMVNMIYKHTIGDFDYFAVHIELALFTLFGINPANCVKGRTTLDSVPFAFGKPKIIIRIDDGELTLTQRYPAESVPVPQAPIQKYRPDNDPNEPERDGYGELNDTPQDVKSEILSTKPVLSAVEWILNNIKIQINK